MSGTMRVAVDAGAVSVARSIAAAARLAPLLVITHRSLADLAAELGGEDAAVCHLARVATNTGKPLAVNLPTGPETSTTVFVSPRGWSDERLRGWAAGHHAELEAAFGPATVRDRGGSVSDDARRELTEEERARIQAAKARGETCGACGRGLAAGETVWIDRLGAGPAYSGRGVIYQWAPVCGTCASPSSLAETEGAQPDRCADCGRSMYYRAGHRRHRVALCSRRCAVRYWAAQAREARGS